MLDALNNACLYVMDFLLGWSLNLPRDLVILLVAVLTGLILTVVRLFTTNQEWLKRCQADKKRLKALIREAKARLGLLGRLEKVLHLLAEEAAAPLLQGLGQELLRLLPAQLVALRAREEKEAVKRHKLTIQMIGMKSFKCEGLPLLASIVPIAMIAVWAFTRLAYMAPDPGKAITLTVDFPGGAHGADVSLVPQKGMTCEGGWLRRVKTETVRFNSFGRLPAPIYPIFHRGDADPNNVPPTTVERATWKVTCQQSQAPYPLLFRLYGETLDHELIVDGKKYYSPVGVWGENNAYSLRMDLPEYKFLGFLPSIDLYWNKGVCLPMDAWILGYLIIVIPLALVLKPVLRIA